MQTEIVIAGFGGQGILFAGQILAYAALDADKVVTWIPSYGPEMRGGTANCTVIISDEEIGSPLVRNPKAAIVMNLPSLERYEPLITPEGALVANASLVNRGPRRSDIANVFIPTNEIAETIGDKRLVSMVALGALLARLPVLTLEQIEKALDAHMPERHKRFLPLNCKALTQGAEFAMKEAAAHPV